MARQNKLLPLRKQADRPGDEESLLLRSAESLGRMIGSLQRQLDGATKRLSATARDVIDQVPDMMPARDSNDARGTGTKKPAARKRAARTAGAASRKTSSARAARTRAAGARKGPASRARADRTSAKKR